MIKNIKLFKINLRSRFRRIRETMTDRDKQCKDAKILHNLCILNSYKKSKTVFTYVSKNIEVDTYEIIKKSWHDGKRVAIPACTKEDRIMDFYYINSFDDMEKGTFGLLEPNKLKCEKVKNLSEGICIVPGFCFDYKTYRLGYGYGYYDRFLQKFGGKTIGICYSNCIIPQLPHGKFDKPVDILITDKYIKEINNK